MAEFSTTKITPTDGVQVPSVSGSTSGYMEMDEVKSYVLGTLPTDVQTNTEDIGENTSDIGGIRGSSQAFDVTAPYSAGDYCIYENVLYRFTSAKSAGAWDSAIVAVVDLPTLDGAITSLTPTLLWTNPNPLDAFSAQEITFANTKNYLLFIIVLSGYTASASLDNAVSFMNVGSAGNIFKTESGSNVSSLRNITASSQTSITFGNGMLNKADGSSTSDNSRAIPHKVYGLFAV